MLRVSAWRAKYFFPLIWIPFACRWEGSSKPLTKSLISCAKGWKEKTVKIQTPYSSITNVHCPKFSLWLFYTQSLSPPSPLLSFGFPSKDWPPLTHCKACTSGPDTSFKSNDGSRCDISCTDQVGIDVALPRHCYFRMPLTVGRWFYGYIERKKTPRDVNQKPVKRATGFSYLCCITTALMPLRKMIVVVKIQ